MKANESLKKQGIQVISRAADILRLLGRETGGLSLGQIAEQVELPRSTVQRIVAALADEGFIANINGNGNIRLGDGIQILAQACTESMQSRLSSVMNNLSKETGETVDLAILENQHMRFIDQVEGSQRLRTVSSIGESFPLTTTANGKAALACLDRTTATKLIKSELGIKGQTSKLFRQLITELDDVESGNLARDENEHTEGICALGFAMKDNNGDVFALSTPVPSTRYHRIKNELAAAMRREVNQFQLR